jgi:hypothetical protein
MPLDTPVVPQALTGIHRAGARSPPLVVTPLRECAAGCGNVISELKTAAIPAANREIRAATGLASRG